MHTWSQIRFKVPDKNKSKFPLLNRQWWPLVVTVLRTGCILTTGHPLQVHASVPRVFIEFPPFSCTAVHGRFLAV